MNIISQPASMEKIRFKIIAIDLSSTTTGYAVFEKNFDTINLCESGVLDFGNDAVSGSKLANMGKVIYHFILVHNPKLILLERIPHCRQMKVAVALGKVHGVFYEQVYLANSADTIPIVEIDNTVWKKAFTGRGRAEKPEIKEHITRYYKQIKLQTPLYDESDAIAMGIAYLTGQVKERRE